MENNENKTNSISRRDALKRIAKNAVVSAGIVGGVMVASSCNLFYYDYSDVYYYYVTYYY